MKFEYVYSNNVINIFTDGSTTKLPSGETAACSGAISTVIMEDGMTTKAIGMVTDILRNSTNNEAELHAINLGVTQVLYYISQTKIRPIINIFSDSKISIMGLREWIFDWSRNIYNSTLYTSSGTVVANQEIYIDIIYKIINNRIRFNFYHIKGHVNDLSEKSLLESMNVFKASNGIEIKDDIVNNKKYRLLRTFAYWNNYIDNQTRNTLISTIDNTVLCVDARYTRPVKIDPSYLNLEIYRDLINYRQKGGN